MPATFMPDPVTPGGIPAAFMNLLGDSDDSSNGRGRTAKFYSDTLIALNQFADFQAFSLKSVNLNHALLWEALDTIKREMGGSEDTDAAAQAIEAVAEAMREMGFEPRFEDHRA